MVMGSRLPPFRLLVGELIMNDIPSKMFIWAAFTDLKLVRVLPSHATIFRSVVIFSELPYR